eukprot:s3032_g5.t1
MLLSVAGLSGECFELRARRDGRVEDLWKEVERHWEKPLQGLLACGTLLPLDSRSSGFVRWDRGEGGGTS